MSLLHDVRFALRLIVKEPWFTAVAVAALALGIGVNATVFTLVNAVLVRGLPFKEPSALYMVGPRRPNGGMGSISWLDLQEWREQTRTFAGLAGFSRTNMNISDDRGLPQQARGTWLTANAFQVLGQQPLLGRDFAPADDRKGAERVVILGYSIWKNRYGGDPDILGHPLRINGEPATIVGVMPEGMMFPTDSALWGTFIPTASQESRENRPLDAFGRLRRGASRTEAQAELDGIAGRLAAQYPETNKELTGARVQTFNERFNGGDIRQVFLAMMGAVGFVLLIACANVANLLLSRAAHRSREIAVRVALGASRWRVVRQLLIESVVLGFIGGALGLLLAVVGVRLFDAAVSVEAGKPYWIQFTMDWVVFAFLAGICVLTGILFGLAPALQVTRTNVNEVLKEGGRGNAGNRRSGWLSSTMVVVELTLTIVLLVGAGLMTRSFLNLYSLDLGIETDRLMSMSLQLPSTKYGTPELRREFYDRLTPRLLAIAGAEAVSITTAVPPSGGWRRTFEIDGRPAEKDDRLGATDIAITPGFFDTVGARIVRGRDFTHSDGTPGSESVIINQRFASEFFPGEDPIGRRVRFTVATGQPVAVWRTIVGICPTIRHYSRQDIEPKSVIYLPLRQEASGYANLLFRSHLDPGVMMTAVRKEVQAVDADQPVFTVQTVNQSIARQRWPNRVFGAVFAIFAAIALLLSAVGIYAVMAYSVTQRTQEIGVRMALGAEGRQVSWLILKRGLIQLTIGLTLGLTGAFLVSRAIRPLLVSIAPTDTFTFVLIALLITAVSVAACLIPARRATRLNPLVALRED